MIPQAYITEWSNNVLWQTNEQVEQDLIICRALVEIFSDAHIAERLAFRGGTALHKLYLHPQPRYSEDIDLVQIKAEPIKATLVRLQQRLNFLGKSSVSPKKNNNTLKFQFVSEIPPVQTLKLKVETNCREHFSVLGYQKFPFEVDSSYFKGKCYITTYKLEELLGTKLRALYQISKCRDLFNLHKALSLVPAMNKDEIIHCYHEYMSFVVAKPPTQKLFLQNLEAKMKDPEFLGDIVALLRPDEVYNHSVAYNLVRKELIEKILI